MTALVVVLLVLAALVALLAVPMELVVRVAPGAGLRARGQWLFGAVGFDLPGVSKPTEHGEKPTQKRSRGGGKRAWAMLRAPGVPSSIVRLTARLLHILRPRDVRLRVRVGLEDPADTGMLWAALGPVSGALAASPADLHIEPDFLDEVVEIDGRGTFRVVPLQVLSIFLAAIFSAPAWRALQAARRA